MGPGGSRPRGPGPRPPAGRPPAGRPGAGPGGPGRPPWADQRPQGRPPWADDQRFVAAPAPPPGAWADAEPFGPSGDRHDDQPYAPAPTPAPGAWADAEPFGPARGGWDDEDGFGSPTLGYPAPLGLVPEPAPAGPMGDHYTGEHPPLDLGPASVRSWDDEPDRVDVGSTVRPWADDRSEPLDDPTAANVTGFYDRPWYEEEERTFALAVGDIAHEDIDVIARRRGRRRRRAVLVAVAAVLAVAVPFAAMSTTPGDPALAVEVLPGGSGEAGRVQLSGWLAEGPNGEAPEVRIEIDGKKAEQAVANGRSRQRWEWRGPRDERGFSMSVPVGSGAHRVCVVAVSDGRTLQCEDVDVKPGGGPSTADPTTGAFGSGDAAAPGTATSSAPPITPETTAEVTVPTTVAPPPAPTPVPTTKAPAPATTARPPVNTAPADTSWQGQMLAMVNTERANAGLKPVAMCGTLTRSAQSFAELMATTNQFSHTAGGTNLGGRTRAAGYTSAGGGWSVAENIAKGQTSVQQVMSGWMNSAGHKANLLAAGTTHVGFGKATNGSTWWVQNFGSGGTC